MEEHNCLPVFLSDDIIERYYNGFSNGVLWPLFHYVPLSMYKVKPTSGRIFFSRPSSPVLSVVS